MILINNFIWRAVQ